MHEDILNLLNLNLGELGSVFNDMILAENEIQRAMDTTEEQETKKLIYASFSILRRPIVLTGKSSDFYRAHVRELLNRIMEKKPLEKPTNAEIAAAFVGASLLAPLESKAAAIAIQAFISASAIAGIAEDEEIKEIASLAESFAFPRVERFYEEEAIEFVEKVLKKNDPELYSRRAQFFKMREGAN